MISISEEYVLSGAHICSYNSLDNIVLGEMTWVLGTAWEIFALCLSVWIAVKHFRETQRPSSGWTVGDCFMILIKTRVFYFARFVYDWKVILFPAHASFALVMLLFLPFSRSVCL
jgi:hypothetical protein